MKRNCRFVPEDYLKFSIRIKKDLNRTEAPFLEKNLQEPEAGAGNCCNFSSISLALSIIKLSNDNSMKTESTWEFAKLNIISMISMMKLSSVFNDEMIHYLNNTFERRNHLLSFRRR
jgi:hypothetical protein